MNFLLPFHKNNCHFPNSSRINIREGTGTLNCSGITLFNWTTSRKSGSEDTEGGEIIAMQHALQNSASEDFTEQNQPAELGATTMVDATHSLPCDFSFSVRRYYT